MNPNVICWFEIYVHDLERAKKFYQEVLGTPFTDTDAPGDAAGNMNMSFFPSDEKGLGVSGALVQMKGAKEGDGKGLNTMVYFPCQDCSVEEAKVPSAGGKVCQAKMSIGQYGFCSICQDTEGNTFGLHSME